MKRVAVTRGLSAASLRGWAFLILGVLLALPLAAPAQALCGNGIEELGEQCDDGNTADGDGCSSTCQFEATATPTSTPPIVATSTPTPTIPGSLTFVVNSSADTADASPGDGICDDGTGSCTLRAAAEDSSAAANTLPCTANHVTEVVLGVAGPIVLGAPVSFQAGQCFRTVRVIGPGSENLTIRDAGLVLGGSGAAGERAEVSGLTIASAPVGIDHRGANLGLANGVTLSDVKLIGNGTGVQFDFRAQLTLRNCRVAENIADGIGPAPFSAQANGISVVDSAIVDNGGAGIFGYASAVSIVGSTISGNSGLGITGSSLGSAVTADVTISDSTIASNGGVGVANWGTETTITGSTISDNAGGGVSITLGPAAVWNSTISGNRSPADGGGFSAGSVFPSQTTFNNTTIVSNTADSDGDGSGDGGGVHIASGTATVSNSIIAGNTDGGGEAPDCSSSLTSGGYNLIQSTSGCAITGDTTGNLIGVDPLLGLLRDNGGPTHTRSLLPGSPAIDGGNPLGCVDGNEQPLTTDQRGTSRPQFGACDIGAYEFACSNGVVDLGEQCDDGNLSNGDCCSSSCQFESGTTVCRAPADSCDVADMCSGTSAVCPTDVKQPDGTSCADGQFCNGAEQCRGGVCQSGVEPCLLLCDEPHDQCATGCPQMPQTCRSAEKSTLMIRNKVRDRRDKLIWKWAKGSQTSQAELGDPTSTADYALCVYAGAASGLVGEAIIPADMSRWSALSADGYIYEDATAAEDGIFKVVLEGSERNKSKVQVKGRGPELTDVPLPVAAPVTVQLINGDNGLCWGTSYSAAQIVKNDNDQLKAKSQ